MTQTTVPMERAMRVVGLLKQEIAGRKAGYRIIRDQWDDLHDDFVETLNQLRLMLGAEDFDRALDFVIEKLDETIDSIWAALRGPPFSFTNWIPAMTMIELAQSFAAQGFTVLPVNPATKAALTKNWTNRPDKGEPGSSKDPDQVTAWWTQWPNACVGLRTGKINGFVVVDVDRHGHSRRLQDNQDV